MCCEFRKYKRVAHADDVIELHVLAGAEDFKDEALVGA
jgi:hypothetical protein